jgi:hypothetical protein
MWPKIKDFFIIYEHKIILILGFVLVAAISFEAGMIKGKEFKEKPLIIESPAFASTSSQKDNNNAPEAQKSPPEGQNDPVSPNIPASDCAYIGSKNSNKYHLPNCRWAKNIKPENIACFKDKLDAESKGYLPDKNCIK